MTEGGELLERLERERNRYGPATAAVKLGLLAALATARLRRPRDLAAFHGHLLFLRAFPDDERVRLAAAQALKAFARRARDIPAIALAALDDSGLVRSTSRHSFEAPIAAWLADRFGAAAEIDWRGIADSSGIDWVALGVQFHPEEDRGTKLDIGVFEQFMLGIIRTRKLQMVA